MVHRYPRRLMPKHNYSLIDESFIRERMRDFFVLRRVKYDESKPDIKSKLRSQFQPTTFKNGISVVLLSVLRKEDVCWCCRKPCGKTKGYESKWIDNNKKAIFPKNKHLKYDKRVSFGGYKISEVFNYETDFPVDIKEKDVVKKRIDTIKLRIVHEPLCFNFWHCEIFLYRIKEGDCEKETHLSNKELERAGNMIIDDLADMAYPKEDAISLFLKKSVYRRCCK